MPQFDLAVFPAQIFWLIIFFSILMLYTVSVSVPCMKKLLEERWQKTDGYRLEADRYSEEHKATLQQIDKDISRAKKEAYTLIAQTQSDVNGDFSDRKNQMITLMKTQISQAESTIAAEKMKAAADIKEHTQTIAQNIVSKLLPIGGNGDDIKTLLNDKIDVKKVSNGN